MQVMKPAREWKHAFVDGTARIAPDVRIGYGTIVGPDVEIGPGSTIWHHANLMPGAKIGRNAMVGFACQIDPRCVVGDETRIQPYSVLGAGAQVGARVFLGPYTCLTNSAYPPSSARLHGVVIEDDVVLNAGTVVLASVRVGRRSVAGAKSLITRDVSEECEVRGIPARVVGSRSDYDRRQSVWNLKA